MKRRETKEREHKEGREREREGGKLTGEAERIGSSTEEKRFRYLKKGEKKPILMVCTHHRTEEIVRERERKKIVFAFYVVDDT